MIKTYIIRTDTLPDPLHQADSMQGLPKERIEKITRIKHEGARKQSFGAGLLLKEVLKKTASGAEISYNSFGKPFAGGIPFSLSHTDNAAVLSIWETAPDSRSAAIESIEKDGRKQDIRPENREPDSCVKQCPDLEHLSEEGGNQVFLGCDIEILQRCNPKIARRFFTGEEYRELEEAGSEQEKSWLFTRYWTRKESVMKLTGLGMALPMDIFDVRNAMAASVNREKVKAWADSVKEKLQPEYARAAEILQNCTLFFKEYRLGSCCITVCSTVNRFAAETIML